MRLLHLVIKMQAKSRNKKHRSRQAPNKLPVLLLHVKILGERFDQLFIDNVNINIRVVILVTKMQTNSTKNLFSIEEAPTRGRNVKFTYENAWRKIGPKFLDTVNQQAR